MKAVHDTDATSVGETKRGLPPRVNLGSTWGQPGVNLGSTWGHPGVNLGSSWGHPGVNLGSSWGQPGVILGSSRGQPAPLYLEGGGGQAGQPLLPYLSNRRAIAAQVEIESKVWKRFMTFYYQTLEPGAISTRILILTGCTALPSPSPGVRRSASSSQAAREG